MPGRSEESRLIRSVRTVESWTHEYGPTLLVACSGLGWTFLKDYVTKPAAVASPFDFLARPAAGSILSAMLIAGAIWAYRRSGQVRDLKATVFQLERSLDESQSRLLSHMQNARVVWRVSLADIARDLGLDATFRISIYRYSVETRTFNMLGRYASIRRFNEIGRVVYPADLGCIGQAWESPELEAIADCLPADAEDYVRESCDRWGFDAATVRSFTMRSRSIYAFTILDALKTDRTAIIVFESTEPKAIAADVLRQAVNGRFRSRLLSELDSLSFLEPVPELALRKGF